MQPHAGPATSPIKVAPARKVAVDFEPEMDELVDDEDEPYRQSGLRNMEASDDRSLLHEETHALDAIFEAAIQKAILAEARYFDFGTSNEDGGKVLNSGLYQFKSEFGGGGVAHEFYQLNIL